jgi:hypothetical protein
MIGMMVWLGVAFFLGNASSEFKVDQMKADWYGGLTAGLAMQALVGNGIWRDALEIARMPDDCFFNRSREETLLLRHRREIECAAASAVAKLVVQLERKVV